ncbi:hypothetical protein [Xanthomonas phage RTH11]|nr:hypothetical protein [Xanthomonas phage RTH11]
MKPNLRDILLTMLIMALAAFALWAAVGMKEAHAQETTHV